MGMMLLDCASRSILTLITAAALPLLCRWSFAGVSQLRMEIQRQQATE
jgi:hypothetical protein